MIGTVFSKNNLSGVLGGVQAGYNWQANNNFVLGVEGEYSCADLSGTWHRQMTVRRSRVTSGLGS